MRDFHGRSSHSPAPDCCPLSRTYILGDLATETHDEAFFWATHQGAEIDLILRRGDRLFGVECKRADAPRVTASIRIALEGLRLDRVAVIYPGAKRFAMADRVEAVPLDALAEPARLFDGEAT